MFVSRPASRLLAAVLILAGIVIALLSIFADTFGFGSGRGFGYYQMIILIGGIVISLVGVVLLMQPRTPRDDSSGFEPEP